jgi:small subunit ribosomal protein S2
MIKEKKEKSVKKDVEIPSLEEMLKAGVHFGHKTSKWNSQMKSYIFTSRNNVHIIDLEQTQQKLKEALQFIQSIKEKKGKIVFVGTKVAAKDIAQQTAKDCKMFYVTERWIGGTLTNFQTISDRLSHFRDLEKKKKSGELEKYTKKEQQEFGIELDKLERRFGGIKEMTELPAALFVVDVHDNVLAVKEAKAKGIPVVGLCDTNADPTSIDYSIPANDDAISSLQLIFSAINKALK